MLTCREVIMDFLADYLDAALSPQAVAELEQHLAVCPPCVAYLNTYKKTRGLINQSVRAEMPAEMKALLKQFLLKHLEEGKP